MPVQRCYSSTPPAGTSRCRVPSLTSSRPSTKLTRRSANGSAIAEQVANKKGSQVATPGWRQVATHRAMVLQVIEKTGGCRGTRTLDPLIKSQLLRIDFAAIFSQPGAKGHIS